MIAVLPSMIHPKQPFSDGLGGGTDNQKVKLMCDKIIKLANLQIKGRIEQQTRVYSTKGISPTLNSAMGHGGNCIPLFLIVKEI